MQDNQSIYTLRLDSEGNPVDYKGKFIKCYICNKTTILYGESVGNLSDYWDDSIFFQQLKGIDKYWVGFVDTNDWLCEDCWIDEELTDIEDNNEEDNEENDDDFDVF